MNRYYVFIITVTVDLVVTATNSTNDAFHDTVPYNFIYMPGIRFVKMDSLLNRCLTQERTC